MCTKIVKRDRNRDKKYMRKYVLYTKFNGAMKIFVIIKYIIIKVVSIYIMFIYIVIIIIQIPIGTTHRPQPYRWTWGCFDFYFIIFNTLLLYKSPLLFILLFYRSPIGAIHHPQPYKEIPLNNWFISKYFHLTSRCHTSTMLPKRGGRRENEYNLSRSIQ